MRDHGTLILKRSLVRHAGWIVLLVIGFLVAGLFLVQSAFIARAIGAIALVCLVVATFRIHWTRAMLVIDREGITPLYRSRERIPWAMVLAILPETRDSSLPFTREPQTFLRIRVSGARDILVPVSDTLHPHTGIVGDAAPKTPEQLIRDIESFRSV